MSELLNINDMSVKFPTRFGEYTALDSIDLAVKAGEIHGLVGESGAGKSTLGAAVIGLLPSPGYISSGKIDFSGKDLTRLDQQSYHRLRGSRISMIFQDPQTSLNPLLTVATQLVETIRQHSDINPLDARSRAIALLEEIGLYDVEQRIDDYPHQFSGGMRQRVVIALALCTDPELIIADEPTTALDVSVQKQILELIRTLCTERQLGIILITHDIGVINEITDHVTVLRSGRVIETGTTGDVLGNPSDEYTKALMAAVPRLDKRLDRFKNIVAEDLLDSEDNSWRLPSASAEFASQWLLAEHQREDSRSSDAGPVVSVEHLDVTFARGQPSWIKTRANFKALSDITLAVRPGEILGVVGESGSGKSTLAKAIVGLVSPSAGTMTFRGEHLPPRLKRHRNHVARRQIQMVFQDPYSSLNNRKSVEQIISEPIRFYGLANDEKLIRKLVASVLELVEMPQRAMLKYPHQFSGGQRQRIAVARALVARPEFLICDEPTSALDVSIQAQILNLLKDLQQIYGLSILFISHNLAVIWQMADRVVVLKQGELVETAETEQFFRAPSQPYSQMLLSETPSLELIQ